MQDPAVVAVADQWSPGKGKVEIPLTKQMLLFLSESYAELAAIYEEADNPIELLKLLEEAGWIQANTDWTPARGGTATHYENRVKTKVTADASKQLRIIVSYSSRQQLSITEHIWYKPGA